MSELAHPIAWPSQETCSAGASGARARMRLWGRTHTHKELTAVDSTMSGTSGSVVR